MEWFIWNLHFLNFLNLEIILNTFQGVPGFRNEVTFVFLSPNALGLRKHT